MLCVLRETHRSKFHCVESTTPEQRTLTGSISGRLLANIANMKAVLGIFAILALLFVFRATDGQYVDNTNGCETNCNMTYDPICGTDDSGRSKMFTNECVLKSENCLHKTNFQRTANGTCP